WARSPATSPHTWAMAASTIWPRSSVIEELPTLTTTVRPAGPAPEARTLSGASRPSVGLPLQLQVPDPHQVALAGTGPGQRPVHSEVAQAALGVGEGPGVVEVGQRHRPLGLAAVDD